MAYAITNGADQPPPVTMLVSFNSFTLPSLENKLLHLTNQFNNLFAELVRLKTQVTQLTDKNMALEQKNGMLEQKIQELSYRLSPSLSPVPPNRTPPPFMLGYPIYSVPSHFPVQRPLPTHPVAAMSVQTNLTSPASRAKYEEVFIEGINHLMNEGDLEQALNIISLEITQNGNNVEFYCIQSRCFRLLQRYGECINAADNALKLDPSHLKAITNKALALKAIGSYGLSLALIDDVLQKDPKDIFALECKIENLYHMKDYEKFLSCVNYLLSLDSENFIAFTYSAMFNSRKSE